jgi:hypothetical protein
MKSWLCGAALTLMAIQAPADEWVKYAPEDGKFSVLFPTEPEVTVQATQTASGTIPYTTCMSEIEGGAVAYGLAFNDYPESVTQADPEKVLDGGRDGAKANLKGEIISETRMTFAGHPAREFTIAGDVEGQKLLYHTRIVLIGTRLYQLQIVRVGETPVDLADAIRFFASFKPVE